MSSLWFKNAIIYSLDVETFSDSNGDGIGDFEGLISRIDYIAGLGATCLWILPFYPSPNRDNGYDVMDYYNVDERLGNLGDFVRFLEKCASYGIRVIIDLVVNHTSREHPWFESARRDKNSPFRKYYVWSDEPGHYDQDQLILKGEENTMWTFDEEAGQYYLHRFYKEQPDLNIANPVVREEILKITDFWLRLGVSGFRIDAAEMLIEDVGMQGVDTKDLEKFLDTLRLHIAGKNPEVILIAETNILPESVKIYFRGNQRMHMLFNFYGNQHFFLSLATGDPAYLANALKKLPEPGERQQWLHFLRHHDELSLKLLSDKHRQMVFRKYSPNSKMKIYGAGIRRRLAPMIRDFRQLLLSYSLLFSLPGAVLIRYGDEIGMGENISLPGRSSVRTPMQWSAGPNAGFSTAPKDRLVHPVIRDKKFGFKKINVLSQQRDPSSLLNWVERLMTTRKQTPEIGIGKSTLIRLGHGSLFAHACEWRAVKIVFLHNFSRRPIRIRRNKLFRRGEKIFEIFSSGKLISESGDISLPGYGYLWIRVENWN